jgi:hypothetical protein
MPAAITNFVDITVNLAAASAEKFSFGTLQLVASHTVTANRQDGPYSSVSEAVAAGFTVAAAEFIHAWVTAAFAQGNGVDQVLIGRRDAGDATLTESLDAIEADPGSAVWYGTNIDTRTDADIALLATWIESRNYNNQYGPKISISQSDDLTLVAFTALQAGSYNRSAGIYHATDSAALDGAWSSVGLGLNLDSPEGRGRWGYKQISGTPFDPVTSAEATAIYGVNANLYGRNKGLNFTSFGTMASGRKIDTQTTIDWLALRLQEAILSAQVSAQTTIPFTDAGINIIRAAMANVLTNGQLFGHLSPDRDPEIILPTRKSLSATQVQSGELVGTVNAFLPGNIDKVTLAVNLSFG